MLVIPSEHSRRFSIGHSEVQAGRERAKLVQDRHAASSFVSSLTDARRSRQSTRSAISVARVVV